MAASAKKSKKTAKPQKSKKAARKTKRKSAPQAAPAATAAEVERLAGLLEALQEEMSQIRQILHGVMELLVRLASRPAPIARGNESEPETGNAPRVEAAAAGATEAPTGVTDGWLFRDDCPGVTEQSDFIERPAESPAPSAPAAPVTPAE